MPRPPKLWEIGLGFFGIMQAKVYFRKILLHVTGRLSAEEKTFIPESEWDKVYWTARVHLAIYVVVIAWAIAIGSILPLMYVGLPSLYGAWLYITTGLTQHAGLAEDVLDHRLNSRTVYMNPIVAVPLLEHELPRRAPHVPDGALPHAARPARRDEGRHAEAL